MLILSTFFLLTWKWPKIGRNVVFIRDFYSDIKFQIIHCSQRQGGYLENQRVSQQRQRKATNHYLLQGDILYPLHGVHLQTTVQRQLLRQVRAIYFNISSRLSLSTCEQMIRTGCQKSYYRGHYFMGLSGSTIRCTKCQQTFTGRSHVSPFSPRITGHCCGSGDLVLLLFQAAYSALVKPSRGCHWGVD